MNTFRKLALAATPLALASLVVPAIGQPSAIRRALPAEAPTGSVATQPSHRNQAGQLVWTDAQDQPTRIVTPQNLMVAADDYAVDVRELADKGLVVDTDEAATASTADAQRGTITVGALRKQGYLFIDRDTADSLRERSSCSYELGWRQQSGARTSAPWVLGCLIEPSVEARVTRSGNGFTYAYSIANGRAAQQDIFWFQVRLPFLDALLGRREAKGWQLVTTGGVPLNIEGSEGADFGAFAGATKLAPGTKIDGLALESNYFPGVTDARFEGVVTSEQMPPIVEQLPGDLENAAFDLKRAGRNRVTIATVGPVIPPPSGVDGKSAVVAQLRADVPRARTGGLVSDVAAGQVASLLAELATSLDERSSSASVATRLGALTGIDPGYRSALVAAAKALAAQE